MWASVGNIIGYDKNGYEISVPSGNYEVIASNDYWTSIKFNGVTTINTIDISNTSNSDPKDNKPPTKGGSNTFEWQIPKLWEKIKQFFADIFSVSKDFAILIFWLLLAVIVISIVWKSRPKRVRIVK
jgi:hypothetical protein